MTSKRVTPSPQHRILRTSCSPAYGKPSTASQELLPALPVKSRNSQTKLGTSFTQGTFSRSTRPESAQSQFKLHRCANVLPKKPPDITPELAARLVHDHILPMFDRKQKGPVKDELNLVDQLATKLDAALQVNQHLQETVESVAQENLKLKS